MNAAKAARSADTLYVSLKAMLKASEPSMPTVAEANQLWQDGVHFGLDQPLSGHSYGLFNATRLIPDAQMLGDRPRYIIRTVQRITVP